MNDDDYKAPIETNFEETLDLLMKAISTGIGPHNAFSLVLYPLDQKKGVDTPMILGSRPPEEMAIALQQAAEVLTKDQALKLKVSLGDDTEEQIREKMQGVRMSTVHKQSGEA